MTIKPIRMIVTSRLAIVNEIGQIATPGIQPREKRWLGEDQPHNRANWLRMYC